MSKKSKDEIDDLVTDFKNLSNLNLRRNPKRRSRDRYEEIMEWLKKERNISRKRRMKEKEFKSDLKSIIEGFGNYL